MADETGAVTHTPLATSFLDLYCAALSLPKATDADVVACRRILTRCLEVVSDPSNNQPLQQLSADSQKGSHKIKRLQHSAQVFQALQAITPNIPKVTAAHIRHTQLLDSSVSRSFLALIVLIVLMQPNSVSSIAKYIKQTPALFRPSLDANGPNSATPQQIPMNPVPLSSSAPTSISRDPTAAPSASEAIFESADDSDDDSERGIDDLPDAEIEEDAVDLSLDPQSVVTTFCQPPVTVPSQGDQPDDPAWKRKPHRQLTENEVLALASVRMLASSALIGTEHRPAVAGFLFHGHDWKDCNDTFKKFKESFELEARFQFVCRRNEPWSPDTPGEQGTDSTQQATSATPQPTSLATEATSTTSEVASIATEATSASTSTAQPESALASIGPHQVHVMDSTTATTNDKSTPISQGPKRRKTTGVTPEAPNSNVGSVNSDFSAADEEQKVAKAFNAGRMIRSFYECCLGPDRHPKTESKKQQPKKSIKRECPAFIIRYSVGNVSFVVVDLQHPHGHSIDAMRALRLCDFIKEFLSEQAMLTPSVTALRTALQRFQQRCLAANDTRYKPAYPGDPMFHAADYTLRNFVKARGRTLQFHVDDGISAVRLAAHCRKTRGDKVFLQLPKDPQKSQDDLILVVLTRSCLYMLSKYGVVFGIDATYRTNKYKFPVFLLVAYDNSRRGQVCGLIVIGKEDAAHLAPALRVVRQFVPNWKPRCAVSDKCEAERNALKMVFADIPGFRTFLCEFHRLKAIIEHLRTTITSSTHGDAADSLRMQILAACKRLAWAESVDEYQSRKADFLNKLLVSLPNIKKYMLDTWFVCEQDWAMCFRDVDFNNMTTTNVNERANRTFKLILLQTDSPRRLDSLIQAFVTTTCERFMEAYTKGNTASFAALSAPNASHALGQQYLVLTIGARQKLEKIVDAAANIPSSAIKQISDTIFEVARKPESRTALKALGLDAVAEIPRIVDLSKMTCTCVSSRLRGLPCGHLYAVHFATKTQWKSSFFKHLEIDQGIIESIHSTVRDAAAIPQYKIPELVWNPSSNPAAFNDDAAPAGSLTAGGDSSSGTTGTSATTTPDKTSSKIQDEQWTARVNQIEEQYKLLRSQCYDTKDAPDQANALAHLDATLNKLRIATDELVAFNAPHTPQVTTQSVAKASKRKPSSTINSRVAMTSRIPNQRQLFSITDVSSDSDGDDDDDEGTDAIDKQQAKALRKIKGVGRPKLNTRAVPSTKNVLNQSTPTTAVSSQALGGSTFNNALHHFTIGSTTSPGTVSSVARRPQTATSSSQGLKLAGSVPLLPRPTPLVPRPHSSGMTNSPQQTMTNTQASMNSFGLASIASSLPAVRIAPSSTPGDATPSVVVSGQMPIRQASLACAAPSEPATDTSVRIQPFPNGESVLQLTASTSSQHVAPPSRAVALLQASLAHVQVTGEPEE